MQTTPTTAIIGGGPGGLTLARILSTRGIPSEVFELDAHPLARPQGGTLDLHEDSGLLALRLAGLEAEFNVQARYEDQESRIYDAQGTLHFEHSGTAAQGDRPEIDRTQLRDILLRSLPAGTVRWNSKVRGVVALPNGQHRVLGEDGPLGDFDLVVGADGTWSKVRPLLSKETPAYTGVTFVEVGVDDVDTMHPGIARLVGRGKASVVGPCNQRMIAQRNGHGHVRAYFCFLVPEDWATTGGLDLSSPARGRASLKALLPGWAPSLLEIVDRSNDAMVARPIVALPVGHHWEHKRGVTLLGDAAHVMSPFGGDGVNLAMQDAADLAVRLAEDVDWDRAVEAFERAMCTRAAGPAAGAALGIRRFSEGSLEETVAMFRSVTSGQAYPAQA